MGCNTTKTPRDEEKNDDKNADIWDSVTDGKHKKEEVEDYNPKEVAAATAIQALYRGYRQRRRLRSKRQLHDFSDHEHKKRKLPRKITGISDELTNAAIKIQATFRGHMSRKEQASGAGKSAVNMVGSSATAKIEEKMQDAVHELEGIDLADPDLHKAATKIQASFRGHKVRQEVCMHSTADESKK